MIVSLTSFAQETVSFARYITNMNSEEKEEHIFFTDVIFEYDGDSMIYVETKMPYGADIDQYCMLTKWKRYEYDGGYTYFAHVYNIKNGDRYNAFTDRKTHFILIQVKGGMQTKKSIQYIIR